MFRHDLKYWSVTANYNVKEQVSMDSVKRLCYAVCLPNAPTLRQRDTQEFSEIRQKVRFLRETCSVWTHYNSGTKFRTFMNR